jgi:hypothetical protein
MKTAQWKSLLLTLLFLLFAADTPAGSNESDEVIDLNSDFYQKMRSEQIIQRDLFLDKMINSRVAGSGIIESSRKEKKYGKDLLIIAVDKDSGKHQLKVIYQIYAHSDVDPARLIPGGIIEFKGILVLHTPLNTGRSMFLIDIILD